MPPSDTRFFTEDWIITVPSLPTVKFLRLIPTRSDELIKILSNPLNSPFASASDLAVVWDEERRKSAKERFLARYNLSKTKYQALEILVQIDTEIVGQGNVYEIPEVQAGLANIGINLAPSARAKGIGRAAMQVLMRLANELNVSLVHAGTMSANRPMRALAKSLGFTEREEVLSVPGRGVVAEILFEDVNYQRYKDLEMNVEFLGPVPE
jgi:RimJ/RimL family protein N-acetyltransferase